MPPNIIKLIYILLIAGFVHYRYRKSYSRGIALAGGLLVALPNYLLYATPGSVPDFSVQRVLLIVMLINWYKAPKVRKVGEVKFIGLIYIFIISSLISTILSPVFVASIKEFISFSVEIVLFYVIIMTSRLDDNDYKRIIYCMCIGLTVVAFFGFTEKYFRFNPVDRFLPGYVRGPRLSRDIMSTYPHRILFGVSMAMGWPLASTLSEYFKKREVFKSRILLFGTILMLGALYFSMSRGPWLAGVFGVMIFATIGTAAERKKVVVIGALLLLTLTLKPGVYQSINNLGASTFEEGAQKAGSYNYRWELWKKAVTEIRRSPERLAFGYGFGAHQGMDWSGILSWNQLYYDFWSWDNHYACNLLELGLAGFMVIMILYTKIILALLRKWRFATGLFKEIGVGMIACLLVYLFMMSNVYIFAPQLNYLFWGIAAIGFNIGENEVEEKAG
jgi:O-antigen ligase